MTFEEMREALRRFAKEEDVEIQLLDGRCRVRARVWKVWAIHRSIKREKDFTLTHIPTGFRVARHHLEYTLAVLAVRLDALGDWNSPKQEELPLKHGRNVLKEWRKEVWKKEVNNERP